MFFSPLQTLLPHPTVQLQNIFFSGLSSKWDVSAVFMEPALQPLPLLPPPPPPPPPPLLPQHLQAKPDHDWSFYINHTRYCHFDRKQPNIHKYCEKNYSFFNKYMQHAYNIIIESFGSSCTIGDVNSMFWITLNW